MEKLINKSAVLIEALPYIQEFRNEIVVIKFGGSAMDNPELTKSTMRDIVFMECIGMKPVVVHGGGKAISAKLKELAQGNNCATTTVSHLQPSRRRQQLVQGKQAQPTSQPADQLTRSRVHVHR